MDALTKIFAELEVTITEAYEKGVTMADAERLAARTLLVRMQIADTLRSKDLDARMKKIGVKATKAEVYLAEVRKSDKKPTEAALEALININSQVGEAECSFAEAEVSVQRLETYNDIFKDAHLYFRSIMKGNFE